MSRGLDRDYFLNIIGLSPQIHFRYHFDRLLRRLLKLSYNDDRTRAKPFETNVFVPYILGNTPTPPFHTNFLLGLIAPSESSAEQQAKGQREIPEPEGCGLGYSSFYEPPKKDIIFGRFIQLNSYFAEVISWKPTVSRPVRRRHIAKHLSYSFSVQHTSLRDRDCSLARLRWIS